MTMKLISKILTKQEKNLKRKKEAKNSSKIISK
jgi:hypothetical protein